MLDASGTYGGEEKCIQGCGREHRGKRPRGRPEIRWEDDVRMVVEEINLNNVEWIDLAWDRDEWVAFVKAVIDLRIP